MAYMSGKGTLASLPENAGLAFSRLDDSQMALCSTCHSGHAALPCHQQGISILGRDELSVCELLTVDLLSCWFEYQSQYLHITHVPFPARSPQEQRRPDNERQSIFVWVFY